MLICYFAVTTNSPPTRAKPLAACEMARGEAAAGLLRTIFHPRQLNSSPASRRRVRGFVFIYLFLR